MTATTDNPCLNIEQNSIAFYEALLANYEQAWECLYISVFRSFIPYARQRSSISFDDALDMLQDGMAEFALKLKNGKYVFQGKPIAAYVFTVCRNQWVSFLRKNHIQKIDFIVGDEADTLADEADAPPATFTPDLQPDTWRSSERTQPLADNESLWDSNDVDWKAVSRAFAEVGHDCQAMLHCFYVEEKTLAECGARIGLQENSAKVKRFRCAQRMKTLYLQYKLND
ncbi:RNA polymerase sigma factor [Fibrella arboris]|uniref:RNA polymerase sigma factor n=1 Tax=Fibrella arboris TaxID=3242486 RepID=UPI0035216159